MCELTITSGLVVNPGDKVLLVVPKWSTDHLDGEGVCAQVEHLTQHLREWAPGVDWQVVVGADLVVKAPADG